MHTKGYILLAVQAYKSSLRPCPTCRLEGRNALLFHATLCLLAIGFGGTRGSFPALGADQFDKKNPKQKYQITTYFNFMLLSVTLGATVGVTVIVWVSTEKKQWSLAFLISMLLALLGFAFLAAGKPFYLVRVPGDSPLLKLIQVCSASSENH